METFKLLRDNDQLQHLRIVSGWKPLTAGVQDLPVIRGPSAGGCRQRSAVGSSPVGADGCGRGCGWGKGWEDTTGDGIYESKFPALAFAFFFGNLDIIFRKIHCLCLSYPNAHAHLVDPRLPRVRKQIPRDDPKVKERWPIWSLSA